MKYLYNIYAKLIRPLTPDSRWIHLSETEGRLLEALSNNVLNSSCSVSNYIYRYHNKNTIYAIRNIKHNLVRKTNLNITNYCKKGYILNDEIYIM